MTPTTPPATPNRVPLAQLASSAAPTRTLARIVRTPGAARVAVAAFNSSV